ncbi:hypothetical protein J3F83DRAFT_713341 [Trichoderma novae-zelandiae]
MLSEPPPPLSPILAHLEVEPEVEIEVTMMVSSPILAPEPVEEPVVEDLAITVNTVPEPLPSALLDSSVETVETVEIVAESAGHVTTQANPFRDWIISAGQLEDAIQSFLQRPSTTHDTVLQLVRFLTDDPAYLPPSDVIPQELLENKIRFIQAIRRDMSEEFGQHDINVLQFVYFCMMPTERVRQISTSDWEQNEWYMEMLGEAAGYISFVVRASRLRENPAEKEKALARDGYACILTGGADAKACRILPFATTATRHNAVSSWSSWFILQDFMDESTTEAYDNLLRVAGSSDKSWNMISMTPAMQSQWKRCFFALKCLGITPTGGDNAVVRLQFHWMLRNGVNPQAVVSPVMPTIRRLLRSTPASDRPSAADARRATGRRLENGHTFDLSMTMAEAQCMKVAVDIQWIAIRLAAISGLARTWEAGNENVDLESLYTDDILPTV